MTTPVAVAIHGASGRMGQALVRLAAARDDIDVVAAIVRESSVRHGQPIEATGSALVYRSVLAGVEDLDAVIDFSGADGFDAALAAALAHGVAFVSGSTGLDDRQIDALDAAAARVPVLWASNFSVGIAVLRRLVRDAARALPGFDCEIVETHHRHKKDAPSGTALTLGRAVADGRREAFDAQAVTIRDAAHGPRRGGEIGFAVTRGGDVAGDHCVMLLGDGERLELGHRAGNRDIFARGALDAAVWLQRQPPGRYTLDDVIG